MNLYIPELGDELRLLANWTFCLYNEDRNSTLMEFIKDPREPTWHGDVDFTAALCTIPAGAVLKIDRIYIRKGNEEYSSLTFLWMGMRTTPRSVDRHATAFGDGTRQTYNYKVMKPARAVRFWAKLSDVNKIIFEVV